ncbi:MAG: sialidase family protein [Isosphaeraceae bacterium]
MVFAMWILVCLPLLPLGTLPSVEWDAKTVRLVAEGGDYGRIVRLHDGRTASVFDRQRKMWFQAGDASATKWDPPVLVAEDPDCWLTNAELLVLRDGTMLYFWDERPLEAVRRQREKLPPGALTRPFRIRLARSRDGGRTWTVPTTVHTAGPLFGDGCWEPAAIQLPSGEVQVYFADESLFTKSNEQEIARRCSRDAGATWGPAERVSLRDRHRDGMPAPLILADGTIVVAVEDDGLSGDFKPAIVRVSPAVGAAPEVVDGASPNRWGALAKPLPAWWYAGAPCLRRLPSGLTLLSYQESAFGGLARCRMAVCVGDRHARNFTNKTYPLPLGPRGNQAWNSLFVKDEKTITAVLTATVNGVRGTWAVDGRLQTETNCP